MSTGLSKSRFVTGWKCHNMLWWTVHEPDAPELRTAKWLQDIFDQGTAVGIRAQTEFPGGVLIDLPYNAYREKVEATKEALAAGAAVIFEASFLEDGVFVAVDVLQRTDDGFVLIEVKASKKFKEEKHVPDAAVQLHVLRRAGLDVHRVELMHLNKEHRRPDVGPLFVREDITEHVLEVVDSIPDEIKAQKEMLGGAFPDLPLGVQCVDVGDCAFKDRCWPRDRDGVRTLHNLRKRKKLELIESGIELVVDVPDDYRLGKVAARQVRAVRAGELIVEPGLAEAIAHLEAPIGFLDFETITRALPPWDRHSPWSQVPVQFSYHELQPDGSYRHHGWLADGPEDPSRELAEQLINACYDATAILCYHNYENTQLENLKRLVPERADELEHVRLRLFDLHKVIAAYVYHPDFQGRLGLKSVLPALVPELGYHDLEIQGGMDASVDISRMILRPDSFAQREREELREHLLAYCERDTWAMVKLLEALQVLAGSPPAG